MEDLERELKESALSELEDHLTELGDVLNNKEPSTISEEEINQIFRIVHSVKGNCQASGFYSISDISHLYESKLIKVKDGSAPYDEYIHSVSLSYLDSLSVASEALKSDMDAVVSFDEVLALINGEGRAKIQNEKNSSSKKESINVLLIDDEDSILEIIESYVEDNFNAMIQKKLNGQDGITTVGETKFQVIICDYKMPLIDGKEFIKILRTGNSINKDTPIIFLSGFKPEITGDPKIWHDVFFLEKPFEESKLVYYVKCSLELEKESAQSA